MSPVFSLGYAQHPGEIPDLLHLYGWSWDMYLDLRDKYHCHHCGNQIFHKDGMTRGGNHLAVWSNTGGTTVKIPTPTGYRIVVAGPRELIVIDNTVCEHRSPYIIEDHRVFARMAGVERRTA